MFERKAKEVVFSPCPIHLLVVCDALEGNGARVGVRMANREVKWVDAAIMVSFNPKYADLNRCDTQCLF